jgi:amino acid transporter
MIIVVGGPTHHRLGPRNWKDPDKFKPYTRVSDEALSKFISFVHILVSVVFTYSGTELLGVTISKADNPRRNVPRVFKSTSYGIFAF